MFREDFVVSNGARATQVFVACWTNVTRVFLGLQVRHKSLGGVVCLLQLAGIFAQCYRGDIMQRDVGRERSLMITRFILLSISPRAE